MTYLKIVASEGGNMGTGLMKILFYDDNNVLIPLNYSNIISYTANARITDTDFNAMLTETGSAPPYRNNKLQPLEYVIYIPNNYKISKLRIQNWTNNSYHAGRIDILVSDNNTEYELIDSAVGLVQNQWYEFIDGILLSKNILLFNNGDYLFTFLRENDKISPNMTSNTTPAPYIASSSSVYNTTLLAYNAFTGNNITSNAWLSNTNDANKWIQLFIGNDKLVNKFEIISRNNTDVNSAPKDFELLGSYDGVTFDKIVEITNQVNWTQNEKRVYELNKTLNYTYYRLSIKNTNGTNYVSIGELIFSYEASFTILPEGTNSFIKYGIKSVRDDLQKTISDISYLITSDSNTMGSQFRVLDIKYKPNSIYIK